MRVYRRSSSGSRVPSPTAEEQDPMENLRNALKSLAAHEPHSLVSSVPLLHKAYQERLQLFECIVGELVAQGKSLDTLTLRTLLDVPEKARGSLLILAIKQRKKDAVMFLTGRHDQYKVVDARGHEVKMAGANVQGQMGHTALFEACKWGDPTVVGWVLDYQQGWSLPWLSETNLGLVEVDPMITDREGQTPLMVAVKKGHLEVVKRLTNNLDLSHHPHVPFSLRPERDPRGMINAEDATGKTALCMACEHSNEQVGIVQALLEGEANVSLCDRTTKRTPLHSACEREHGVVADKLLRQNANPNARDSEGRTPLHLAVKQASLTIVASLIERGAELNVRDNAGDTPLHYLFQEKRSIGDLTKRGLRDSLTAFKAAGHKPAYKEDHDRDCNTRLSLLTETIKLIMRHDRSGNLLDIRNKSDRKPFSEEDAELHFRLNRDQLSGALGFEMENEAAMTGTTLDAATAFRSRSSPQRAERGAQPSSSLNPSLAQALLNWSKQTANAALVWSAKLLRQGRLELQQLLGGTGTGAGAGSEGGEAGQSGESGAGHGHDELFEDILIQQAVDVMWHKHVYRTKLREMLGYLVILLSLTGVGILRTGVRGEQFALQAGLSRIILEQPHEVNRDGEMMQFDDLVQASDFLGFVGSLVDTFTDPQGWSGLLMVEAPLVRQWRAVEQQAPDACGFSKKLVDTPRCLMGFDEQDMPLPPRLAQWLTEGSTCVVDEYDRVDDRCPHLLGPLGPQALAEAFRWRENPNDQPLYGNWASYPSGSYLVQPMQPSASARDMLLLLHEEHWTDDEVTRALALEMTLYSADYDRLTFVQLLLEFPPGAGVHSVHQIQTYKVNTWGFRPKPDMWWAPLEVFCVVIMIVHSADQLRKRFAVHSKFEVSSTHQIGDAVALVTFLYIVFLEWRIACDVDAINWTADFAPNGGVPPSLDPLQIHLHDQVHTTAGFVLLMWFTLLHAHLLIFREVVILITAIKKMMIALVSFGAILGVVYVAFGTAKFLLPHTTSSRKHYLQSILSEFWASLDGGVDDINQDTNVIMNVERAVTALFAIFVVLILMNVLVTLLMDMYTKEKEAAEAHWCKQQAAMILVNEWKRAAAERHRKVEQAQRRRASTTLRHAADLLRGSAAGFFSGAAREALEEPELQRSESTDSLAELDQVSTMKELAETLLDKTKLAQISIKDFDLCMQRLCPELLFFVGDVKGPDAMDEENASRKEADRTLNALRGVLRILANRPDDCFLTFGGNTKPEDMAKMRDELHKYAMDVVGLKEPGRLISMLVCQSIMTVGKVGLWSDSLQAQKMLDASEEAAACLDELPATAPQFGSSRSLAYSASRFLQEQRLRSGISGSTTSELHEQQDQGPSISHFRLLCRVMTECEDLARFLPSFHRLDQESKTLLREVFKADFTLGQFMQLENDPASLVKLCALAQRKPSSALGSPSQSHGLDSRGLSLDGHAALHFLLFSQIIQLAGGFKQGRFPAFLWGLWKKGIDQLSKLADDLAQPELLSSRRRTRQRQAAADDPEAELAKQQQHAEAVYEEWLEELGCKLETQALVIEKFSGLYDVTGSEGLSEDQAPPRSRRMSNTDPMIRQLARCLARLARMCRITKREDCEVLANAMVILGKEDSRDLDLLVAELNKGGVEDGWAIMLMYAPGILQQVDKDQSFSPDRAIRLNRGLKTLVELFRQARAMLDKVNPEAKSGVYEVGCYRVQTWAVHIQLLEKNLRSFFVEHKYIRGSLGEAEVQLECAA